MDCRLGAGEITKKRYVRTGALPSSSDINLYDSGVFTVCGVNSATAGLYFGDLLVEYDVEFFNPKKNPQFVGAMGLYTSGSNANAANWTADPLAGMSNIDYNQFATDVLPKISQTGGSANLGKIVFPVPGMYSVEYQVENPGSTFLPTGFSFLPDTADDVANSIYVSAETLGAVSKGLLYAFKIYTLVAGVTVSVKTATATGTSAGAIISIMSIFCEAANAFLDYAGSMEPPPAPESVQNYVKKHPKCFYGQKMLQRLNDLVRENRYYEQRKQRDLQRDRKVELLEGEKPPEEVELELPPKPENSDSEPELIHEPRGRSREPREKKSKKTDLKSRKA